MFYQNGNCDVSEIKEIITGDRDFLIKEKSRYPEEKASAEGMFKKDLEEAEVRKFRDIAQQKCGISLHKELVTKEEKLSLLYQRDQETLFQAKYSVPQTTEEKKQIPFEGNESIITFLSAYGRTESERSVCTLQKGVGNQQSEMGYLEETKAKQFQEAVSSEAKSEEL